MCCCRNQQKRVSRRMMRLIYKMYLEIQKYEDRDKTITFGKWRSLSTFDSHHGREF